MNATTPKSIVHRVHRRQLVDGSIHTSSLEDPMPRRGHSTIIGKIAKLHQNRRASEIRVLGETLRREQQTTPSHGPEARGMPEGVAAR
ncbi:hypothetical protein [Micromonospora rubida]|uniref:hypothetical protein n=1 Tax=Micromonospora rubida TaxID=2697657 RepID=UPI0013787A48|nr:hypothetical protein [Micromonospora rubida]NBE80151.1 hypothetical protein [Micromonospora rubida]